jgi:hypothetical protein
VVEIHREVFWHYEGQSLHCEGTSVAWLAVQIAAKDETQFHSQMDVCFGEKLSSSGDESIHKLIILLSSSSGLSKAEVKLIVKQFLILSPVLAHKAPVDVCEPYICTTVQNYWKLPAWVDSSANSCDYQLGDGYQNRTNTLVANSENL